jgi:proteic killer suppression protein
MVVSFRHKGLEELYRKGSKNPKGIQQTHVERLRDILLILDSAKSIRDIGGPGLRLHRLKYDLRDFWAVNVQETWRVIFIWEDDGAYELDYIDYHKGS